MGDDFGGAASARPVRGHGFRAHQLGQIARPDWDDPDYLAMQKREQRRANPPPPPIKKLCDWCGENWTMWGVNGQDPLCMQCAPKVIVGRKGLLEKRGREGLVQRLKEEVPGDDESDDGQEFWDRVAGPHPAKAPGDDDPPAPEQPPVSTTKARADSAAMAIRQRARVEEETITMPTPAPKSEPTAPALPQVPDYEWHEGDPPPVDTRKNKGTVKVDWSMLMGIATTRPGQWLKRPGEPHHVKRINQLDGFEATCREGVVYLRAIDPEDWDGDGDDEGQSDEVEVDPGLAE